MNSNHLIWHGFSLHADYFFNTCVYTVQMLLKFVPYCMRMHACVYTVSVIYWNRYRLFQRRNIYIIDGMDTLETRMDEIQYNNYLSISLSVCINVVVWRTISCFVKCAPLKLTWVWMNRSTLIAFFLYGICRLHASVCVCVGLCLCVFVLLYLCYVFLNKTR